MSFGFSIGDLIAVIDLVNRVRKAFVGAPGQFRDISDEVRSLSIVLEDIEVQLSGYSLGSRESDRLAEVSGHCRKVLNKLETILDKYSDLKQGNDGPKQCLKRIWKRLKWEPDDIRDLRSRVTSNTALLNAFLGRISSHVTLTIKEGVDRLHLKQETEDNLVMLNWLTAIDFSTQQQDFISRRQPGTGQWLLDSAEYYIWR